MTASNQSAWTRRLRRLTYFAGVFGTFYLVSSYALDRMREARMRALKDRKNKDLLKAHFTTLLSTLSFTLYALLPTLSPQLESSYPVELTSQALQGLSNPASSQISSISGAETESPSHGILESSVPDMPVQVDSREGSVGGAEDVRRGSEQSEGPEGSVSESWASEFRGRGGDEESSHAETDDGLSSAVSQPISLPLSDLSTSSGSPPSDMTASSHFHLSPSPPRHRDASPTGLEALSAKSKKELWRDLKVQSLTRAITTAYLVPLLYLLTTSQLSTLARERYLADVRASLPPVALASPSTPSKDSWLPSTESGGISGLIAESASLLPNPLALLPTFVRSRLPWSSPVHPSAEDQELALMRAEEKREAEEMERAEAERMYLTYSWWILHEGWRVVAGRVEAGVERVIGPMGLKRELSLNDWEALTRDIRRCVDYEDESNMAFNFTPHLLPSSPLPRTFTPSCPLPSSPPSPHLARLLSQTRTHLASPDAAYLIQSGVDNMVSKLLESLDSELYRPAGFSMFPMERADGQEEEAQTRRLAECLPAFSRWGKGVWEGVPDGGVEAVLGMGEFEGFAGLIFGDWA